MNISNNFTKVILPVATLLVFASNSFAEDYKTVHKLKSGSLISADILNEMFDGIEQKDRTISANDLVGSWSCTKYLVKSSNTNLQWNPLYNVTSDGYFMYINFPLTVNTNGNSTYSWNSTLINPLESPQDSLDKCNGSGVIASFMDDIMVGWNDCSNNSSSAFIEFKRISKTRIKWYNGWYFILCDKVNVPPSKPDSLNATNSGSIVTLTWTDGSNNETGFKIVRRDNVDGNYSEIGTTSSNATTYTDTVPGVGTYWYRIKSVNSEGESVGSNVVKVTVK